MAGGDCLHRWAPAPACPRSLSWEGMQGHGVRSPGRSPGLPQVVSASPEGRTEPPQWQEESSLGVGSGAGMWGAWGPEAVCWGWGTGWVESSPVALQRPLAWGLDKAS